MGTAGGFWATVWTLWAILVDAFLGFNRSSHTVATNEENIGIFIGSLKSYTELCDLNRSVYNVQLLRENDLDTIVERTS